MRERERKKSLPACCSRAKGARALISLREGCGWRRKTLMVEALEGFHRPARTARQREQNSASMSWAIFIAESNLLHASASAPPALKSGAILHLVYHNASLASTRPKVVARHATSAIGFGCRFLRGLWRTISGSLSLPLARLLRRAWDKQQQASRD